ncbi:MAG: AzlC family ABC transporter permease [Actinomycetota bacterium]
MADSLDGEPSEADHAETDDSPRGAILRQVLSISLAVSPFGVAFGVAARQAGLSVIEAMGFSLLVFTGGAQFAAISVLRDAGPDAPLVVTVAAAVGAALLLNLRTLAFGVVMAPALKGSLGFRAFASFFMIDETTAVGSAQADRRWQRYGYLVCGVILFIFWNTSTLLGASVLGGAGSVIETYGFDATIPASFLALLWPRLHDPRQRLIAIVGGIIAVAGAPVLPPGMPIIAAGAAVVLVRPWRTPDAAPEPSAEPEGEPS